MNVKGLFLPSVFIYSLLFVEKVINVFVSVLTVRISGDISDCGRFRLSEFSVRMV